MRAVVGNCDFAPVSEVSAMMATDQAGDAHGEAPHVLRWYLGSSAAAIGRMRHELGIALDRRHVPGDIHEAVLLVANELAANAVEHVGGAVHVVAAFSDGSVRIAVSDSSSELPRLRPPNPVAARGRGLQMVEGLASRWSWSDDGTGKTVWADVPTNRTVDAF